MKTSDELTGQDCPVVAAGAAKPTRQTGESTASARAGNSKAFRRLKWHEMVRRGDFVTNAHRQLEKLEGLTGFRADSFVKPIYRATKLTVRRAKSEAGIAASVGALQLTH